MHSISTWCTLLAAISAPLVATAHSVIDTHADGAGVSGEAFAIQAVTDDTLVSDTLTLDNSLISDAIFTGGLELSDEEEEHHHLRRLLRRRKRGTSKASPRVPKKSRKKSPKKSPKKSSKKKSSKKKSPKKKVSRKKKPSPKKKRTTAKAPSRSKGSGKTIGIQRKGHGTHFAGMGSPTGGCGVPPGKAFDDNGKALPFVALNFNSEFASGSNCGRWVEIELGANCINAGNSQFSICNGGRAAPSPPPGPCCLAPAFSTSVYLPLDGCTLHNAGHCSVVGWASVPAILCVPISPLVWPCTPSVPSLPHSS